MKKNTMQVFIAIVAFCTINNVFADKVPAQFMLKNGSAFDIIYKLGLPGDMVYKQGSNQEVINEDNIIKAGEFQVINTRSRYPMKLSIKRYGYGSSLSPWVAVPDPKDLAKEQLGEYRYVEEYRRKVEIHNKMPIITVKTGYTGGWSFTISCMN